MILFVYQVIKIPFYQDKLAVPGLQFIQITMLKAHYSAFVGYGAISIADL